jgi:tRNA modification GTPase
MGLRPELAAEELRSASLELGRVVGAIEVDEVLDVIFRDFCIGK